MNVLHISYTTKYDNANDASEALDIMTAAYGNETWHYTHPNGHVPDLHILLAGKELGGGNQFLSPCFDTLTQLLIIYSNFRIK